MNKIITTTMAFVLLYSPLFCQAQMVDITTPNGTPVNAYISYELDPDSIKARNIYIDTTYTSAIRKGDATGKYNCHGYAWIGEQSGEFYWFNEPHKYWGDYSYIQTSESEADIIYYSGGDMDHSAIKSFYPSHPTYHVSKWARDPLMLHPPGYGPKEFYAGATPTYYKLNPYLIDGPDEVCYYGSVFELINPPSSIYWSLSDDTNFVLNGMGDYATKVTRIGTGLDSATLYARTGSTSGPVVNLKYIWPCPPQPKITNASDTVCYNGSQFTLVDAPPGTIYWTVSNPTLFSVPSSGNPINIDRIGQGTGSATLSAHIGSVSNSAVATKTITACSPAIISGNSCVCFSSNYTLSSPLPATPPWTLSQSGSVFSIASSNTNSATVVATPQNNGTLFSSASLYAKVGNVQIMYPIVNCALLGSDFLCPTSYYYINNGIPAVWSVSPGFSITPDPDTESGVWITASAPNLSGSVTAVINGSTTFTLNFSSCDYDVYGRGWSGGSSYVSAYPNPVSSILTIEIDEVMAAQIRAQSNFKTGATTPNFDVRLYNASCVLVRNTQTKGGKVTFDVSALPNGFYYLHVYDGIILSPEVIKIIVE